MPKTPDPEALTILKGLIRFAKKERIAEFEYQGFKFTQLGVDPTEKRLRHIESTMNDLQNSVNDLKLKMNLTHNAHKKR